MDDNGISYQKLKRSVNIKKIQKEQLRFQIILQSTQGLLVLSQQKIHKKTLFDHNFTGIVAERSKFNFHNQAVSVREKSRIALT